MNKIIFYIPLLLAASILLVHLIPAEATPGCTMNGPAGIWMSYDDIYTGKIVSISNQTEYVKNNTELSEWQKSADVRINFELERLLKGNPHTSWYNAVPLETYCPGDFCVSGADHYTIGTEIFYIDNFNGNGNSFDGACGIGTATAQDYHGFFDYFEEIYGFSVPKSAHSLGEKTTCNNNEHLLVLRDNGKRACVTEKTSHKMNWNEITNVGIQFQNNTNTNVTYDYPLSSKTTQVKNGYSSSHYQFDSEITLSKLPKIGQTAILTMTYTNLEENSQPYEEDMVQFYISDHFRFVGIDEKDIEYSRYGNDSYYFEEFPSIKQYHENTFSVTIEAVLEGYGVIDIGGRGYQHQFMVFVDEDQTLLVEDYYKIHYPIPETQISKQITSKQPEYTIIPPTSDHSKYGYKVLYKNDTVKTNYDHQTSEKFPLDTTYKNRQGDQSGNIINEYEIDLKFPTMIETGKISASLTIIDDYPLKVRMAEPEIHFLISQNLDFVGIPSDEIEIRHPNKKHFTYPIDPEDLQSDYTETLFATIKAIRTGTADISIYLGQHHKDHYWGAEYYNDSDYYSDKNTFVKNYEIVIGEDETLLLDDYFKKHLSNVETFSEMK